MSERRRIIILGSGFAAIQVARRLDRDLWEVVLVSPRNYFLFTPLLASTAVGTVEFRSIIEPVRALPELTYYRARCRAIDLEARRVRCAQETDGRQFDLEADILVVGVGAAVDTFGVPGVEEHCLFLKDLPDARAIRGHVLDRLEEAAAPGLDAIDVHRLLHFVVIGGGPTGVEIAAELHDLVDDEVRAEYPGLAPRVRITVLEALDEILGQFDAELRAYARRTFGRQHIEVRTNAMVTEVRDAEVVLEGGFTIPSGLAIWSGGNAPTELVRDLQVDKDDSGRILVDDRLRIPGHEGVYALGDCAVPRERAYPATAQVAQKQGKYLGKSLNRLARGRRVSPFEYEGLGMLAYVGGDRALADLEQVKGRGWLAWLFWRSVYLTRLVSLRNKFMVLFDWFRSRVFGRDVSRF